VTDFDRLLSMWVGTGTKLLCVTTHSACPVYGKKFFTSFVKLIKMKSFKMKFSTDKNFLHSKVGRCSIEHSPVLGVIRSNGKEQKVFVELTNSVRFHSGQDWTDRL